MKQKFLTILGTILCIILVPILIINITLIVKSYTNKDAVPDVGGYFPLIVLTDSMYPVIESGDLILCHTAEADEIQVDDVISFYESTHTSVEKIMADLYDDVLKK